MSRAELRDTYSLFSVLHWLFLIFPIAFVAFMVGILLVDNPLHYTFGDLWAFLFADNPPSSFVALLTYSFSIFGILHFYTLPRIKVAMQRNLSLRENISYAPLAQPQPVPLAAAHTLPVSVRAKTNRQRILLELAPVIALLVVIIANLFLWRNSILSIASVVVSMWLVFGQPWTYLGKPRLDIAPIMQVTVAENHLIVTRGRPKLGGTTSIVPWGDTRLFSVIGQREERPMVLRYAPEGNGVTAEWWMYTRSPRWFDVARLDMPYEEYDRRMREILSLVSAKTGLPLLDLR
jgi:hypothetical protein